MILSSTFKYLFIFFVAMFFGVFLWAPFFFDAEVNWDETAFILGGISILDGHLPGVEVWDNKQPLLYFFTAAILRIWRSIFWLRLVSIGFIVATGLMISKIYSLIWNNNRALFITGLYVLASSYSFAQPSFFSEHLAVFFLSASLLCFVLWLTGSKSKLYLFAAGVHSGGALCVRINLGFVPLALLVFILVNIWIKTERKKMTFFDAAFFSLGVLVFPIFLLCLYSVEGHLDLFWRTNIMSALSYASSHGDDGFVMFMKRTVKFVQINTLSQSIGIWAVCIWGFLFRWRALSVHLRSLLALVFVAILFSILKTGEIYAHYSIQLLPVMLLFAPGFLEISSTRIDLKLLRYGTFFLLLAEPAIVWWQASNSLLERRAEFGSFDADPSHRIAKIILEYGDRGDRAFCFDYPVVMFLADLTPVVSVSHASNFTRSEVLQSVFNMDSKEYLKNLFAQDPKFIVARLPQRMFKKHGSLEEIFNAELENRYREIGKVDGVFVFKKKLN